jgi:hypothetical protein
MAAKYLNKTALKNRNFWQPFQFFKPFFAKKKTIKSENLTIQTKQFLFSLLMMVHIAMMRKTST